MATTIGYPRILSRPIRLEWAGWETDTYKLQQRGWKLSAMQDIRGSRLQLAFQYGRGQQFQAITEVIRYNYERMMNPSGGYDGNASLLDAMVLRVQQAVGDEVLIHQHGHISAENWGPIDAEPRFTSNMITRLEDFAHFAGPLIRTNEIIIPEASVPELLERILKLQQPARDKRNRDDIRGEHRVAQKFHAQIISLNREEAA